jgi:hypothetical protein
MGTGFASWEDMKNTFITHFPGSTGLMIGSFAMAVGVGACTATVRTEPVTTAAYVDVGPPVEHIRVAPSVVYEGHPVYWYNNRWYYRHGGGWAFYEKEPEFLKPHRYVVRY